MNHLQVDDLSFVVRWSSRRRTLQITVERDGELVLSAPTGVDEQELRRFVSQKRYWIYTKLAEKEQLQRKIPRKEFVDGEGFLYLGRSYRLKLVDEQDQPLKLINGRFRLRRDRLEQARKVFVHWYTEHAQDWLAKKVKEHAARLEVEPGSVQVQGLGYRWGSCGKGQRVFPLEDHYVAPRHRRVRRGSRTDPPPRTAPHTAILAASGACHAGL